MSQTELLDLDGRIYFNDMLFNLDTRSYRIYISSVLNGLIHLQMKLKASGFKDAPKKLEDIHSCAVAMCRNIYDSDCVNIGTIDTTLAMLIYLRDEIKTVEAVKIYVNNDNKTRKEQHSSEPSNGDDESDDEPDYIIAWSINKELFDYAVKQSDN